VDNLLCGLLGAVIRAVPGTIIAVIATARAGIPGAKVVFNNDMQRRVQASASANVRFDGTFYLRNITTGAVSLTIVRRRLFVDLGNNPRR